MGCCGRDVDVYVALQVRDGDEVDLALMISHMVTWDAGGGGLPSRRQR